MAQSIIRTKRVYDPPEPDDGARVLVDRLWPRGLGKDKAALDLWCQDCTPSTELRRWFHGGGDWDEFRIRYRTELNDGTADVSAIRELLAKGPVTLLYAARNTDRNHALVLAEFLEETVR